MDNGTMQYLRIYDQLRYEHSKGKEVTVTVAKLAEMLYCTPRNVKFVLRKLEMLGWIEWKPGRGRGNGSKLRFLRPPEEVLELRMQNLLEKGRMSEALDLIAETGMDDLVKTRLWSQFNVYLGLHSEPEDNQDCDVLRMIRYRKMERLDTSSVYTAFEVYILGQIFDTLVTYESSSGKFLPKLAHRWESNTEQDRWTFYLRKGVRFHNGRLLTSSDIRDTLLRLRRKNSPALRLLTDIEEVETPGDYTVVFRLSQPNPFFLHLAGSLYMAVVPPESDGQDIPIGSGPFQISELSEHKLSLRAFEGYYGYRPLLDRVDVWFMPNMETGERTYHLSEADQVEGSREVDTDALCCRYLIINFRKEGPHTHPDFRKALRLVYDRKLLVEELGGDRLAPAASFLPQFSAKSAIESGTLAEAATFLRSSGYGGQAIRLVFTDKKEEWIEANWLRRRAEKIGMDLELCPQKPSEGYIQAEEGELAISSEVLEDDWELDLLNFFLNDANCLNRMLGDEQRERIQELFEGFMMKEEQERLKTFGLAQRLLDKENWLLFGAHTSHRAYFNRSLYGLRIGSFGFPNLSRLWVKGEDCGCSTDGKH
ncbi:ABC transporter substrate-binding protein [Saccharibacillus kuerlensis]|uniref:ABC transporter substrate-binding protein n=1 Tax=Saccharibacillus kuerlensis TaxID=459527 RepID=A0ABQ2L4D8_9BACL|nr:ABC transporter substrate-binding protein [Saccharibacillus kuerlensis]GGO02371.1 ABC transporter substrate-binding protein [Saccharibacillus kuerlensis]